MDILALIVYANLMTMSRDILNQVVVMHHYCSITLLTTAFLPCMSWTNVLEMLLMSLVCLVVRILLSDARVSVLPKT